MIPVYRPYLPGKVTRYAHEAISSGWVSSRGPFVERATDLLREVFGYRFVILVNSGTAAGHMVAAALKACRPAIRRIIVPNNVYVAAWNTLLMAGYEQDALEAVDADIATWNYDMTWRLPAAGYEAILAVHNLGNIVPVDKLVERGATVIEDACEGLFGTYAGKSVGSQSFAASLSFFANKTLSSGEGGAFVTSDEAAYEVARSLGDQGAVHGRRYLHDRLAWNYRMTNVQAALLFGQLEHREEIVAMKKRIFDTYREKLPNERVLIQQSDPGTAPANWMMGVRVVGSPGYDTAESFMRRLGVDVRPMFYPISSHEHLRGTRITNVAVATLLHRECFMVPSFPELTKDEQQRVISAVHAFAASF